MRIRSRDSLRWIPQQELPEASALLDLTKPWFHILHAQRSGAGFVYSFPWSAVLGGNPLGMCSGSGTVPWRLNSQSAELLHPLVE